MNDPEPTRHRQLTEDLRAVLGAGDADREQVYDMVVSELRRIAGSTLGAGNSRAGFQATQIIGEVWLKMAAGRSPSWRSRDHFVGWAAKVVRSILVDQARASRALKRGAGQAHDPLSDSIAGPNGPAYDIVALDEALTLLAEVDPKGARIVELCYFGGLSQREAAAVLSIDESTVKRRWRVARAWLQARFGDG